MNSWRTRIELKVPSDYSKRKRASKVQKQVAKVSQLV